MNPNNFGVVFKLSSLMKTIRDLKEILSEKENEHKKLAKELTKNCKHKKIIFTLFEEEGEHDISCGKRHLCLECGLEDILEDTRNKHETILPKKKSSEVSNEKYWETRKEIRESLGLE